MLQSDVPRLEKRLFLSPPHMGGGELRYVHEAFDSNWIAPMGANVEEFERQLSNFAEGKPVVALSSGTAALHLALVRLGVGQGDVVLCQSFTFCASANPIVYQGASPVFIGSERSTWNMCPEALEEALRSLRKRGTRPKAVVYVHLYGKPAQIEKIHRIADQYGVPVVEDAAESLGSKYDGRFTGAFGRYGIFSFNGNKIITTSGGGAIVCESSAEAEKVKFLATQARDKAPYYLHSELGFNYRLSNVSAGIGRGQLEVLADRIASRQANFERYRNALSCFADFVPDSCKAVENKWLTVMLLKPEFLAKKSIFEIQEAFEARNVEVRPLWKPLHTQPLYDTCEYFGNGSETDLFAAGICLPSGSSLSSNQQSFVIESLHQMLK